MSLESMLYFIFGRRSPIRPIISLSMSIANTDTVRRSVCMMRVCLLVFLVCDDDGILPFVAGVIMGPGVVQNARLRLHGSGA